MKIQLSISLIVCILFLGGCGEENRVNEVSEVADEFLTISGIAEETKDGFYVDGYVLRYEEIEKYDSSFEVESYKDKKLEIVAKVKDVEDNCESDSGEIVQCRPGVTSFIYDIESIRF